QYQYQYQPTPTDPIQVSKPSNTKKYQEIPRNTKKYQEIPRNTKKYPRNTQAIPRKTKKYQEIPRNTKKYQEIHSQEVHQKTENPRTPICSGKWPAASVPLFPFCFVPLGSVGSFYLRFYSLTQPLLLCL